MAATRRYPIGAELLTPDHASFRVWAPEATGLRVEVGGVPMPMRRDAGWVLRGRSAGASRRPIRLSLSR